MPERHVKADFIASTLPSDACYPLTMMHMILSPGTESSGTEIAIGGSRSDLLGARDLGSL